MYTNVWYVAARSSELKNKPLHVKMLGTDFVLFRDQEGKPACLSNACPHRGASLSNGSCNEHGMVVCPFHGWQFDREGNCGKIPSVGEDDPQTAAPGVKTDHYPAVEKHGLIWTFLGDEPDQAEPIFELPELKDPSFTYIEHDVIFESNFHLAKFSNLDYVHLPIVHGIKFEDQENPFQPPPHQVKRTDYGLTAFIQTEATYSKGEWENVREKGTQVKSVLKYFMAGQTLRGEVEIGAVGSRRFNCFYEFSTPIDQTTTMMRYYFFRNFMTQKDMDSVALERNLKNILQDKEIAEAQVPRAGPDGMPTIVGKHEDTILKVYWELMHEMRDKGWQIDNKKWQALVASGEYCVVPSIARKVNPKGWQYPSIPRLESTNG